jgi:hypothetical protein
MPKRPLQCPFCENPLAGPVNISTDTLDISGGICTCSAVFVYDRTGHNLGATLMDALYFVCKEDYDRALSLMPDEYETVTLDYNPTSNTAYPTPDRSTKKSPRLIFLKLKKP